jgi:heme a synthase
LSTVATSASARPAEAVDAVLNLRALRLWLWSVAALIFVMVLVGGATRLTESGLSITEWKPVTGVVPPLSDADWNDAFAKYQQIPQFSKLFPDMTLAGFKTIYFWEWGHRLLARIIGAAFLLPLLGLWLTGRLTQGLKRQLLVVTGLLALEPIVGWWMVASGLAQRTEVSQVRLAMHLIIAAATFAAIVWTASGLRARAPTPTPARYRLSSNLVALLIFVQLGLGALVAGLRAGLVYNTWPLMDGRLIPAGLFNLRPWAANFFDDVTTVQFQHRLLAYLVILLALWRMLATARAAPATGVARRARVVAALAIFQAALGVTTLLLVVPICSALLHQGFAMLLFGMAVVDARITGLTPRLASGRR